VSIRITGFNTSFQEWEFLDVTIIPSDGIELGGQCSVVDDTELACEIAIAEDAMLGTRTIVITNGDCIVAKANVLEILEP
jgi:hypothetical protein